ncbi:unnamed protein product, partial [Tilletia controversa]
MASSSVGTESETHAPAESGPAAEGTYRVTEDGNDLLSGDGVEERPEDLVEMELAQERQRRAYNSRHQPMEFATGDYVLVDLKNYRLRLDPTEQARSKLAPRYAGPFPVKSRVGRLAYELDVPPWFKAHPVMPITALEPFKGDPSTSTPRPQAGIAAEGGANELRVDSFVGRRPSILEGGKHFDYLVKWLGSSPSWQSDNRLPLLGWAKEAFEKRARAELGIKRLRHHSTIILPEATALA